MAEERTTGAAAIIPAWNRRDDVLRLLASVAGQTVRPNAVVVVDNASDDGTAEAVVAAAPGAVVLRQHENLGGAGGFNAGMTWAIRNDLPYAWLLDSDAAAEPEALEELLKAIEQPGVAIAGSALHDDGTVRDTGGRINFVTGELCWTYSGSDLAQLPGQPFDVHCVAACSALADLAAVRKCGGMRADYHVFYDDVEFSCRLRRSGYRLVIAPASRVRHKFPEEKPKTPWRLYYSARNWLDFFLRYGRAPWRLVLAVRQFAGAERLARSYELAGAADQAKACRRAIDDARDARLGRIDTNWTTDALAPQKKRVGYAAPLVRGVANALRAKARAPEIVPLADDHDGGN